MNKSDRNEPIIMRNNQKKLTELQKHVFISLNLECKQISLLEDLDWLNG
jgi:hypothetical protein